MSTEGLRHGVGRTEREREREALNGGGDQVRSDLVNQMKEYGLYHDSNLEPQKIEIWKVAHSDLHITKCGGQKERTDRTGNRETG